MPPINDLLSPTGTLIRGCGCINCKALETEAALERCQELRAQAMETPIGAEWTARDRWDYMRHLDETEARLKAQVTE